MRHVFRKPMLVAGILACLFSSAAFAQTVTTTPEQDKVTQEAALQENKEYDKVHGYKNESAAELKEEAAEKKVEQQNAAKNAAWERDKETQMEALKENKDYDKAHGYSDEAPAEAATLPAVTKETRTDESWKEAVEKDKATQEAALEVNREYDAARGYNK